MKFLRRTWSRFSKLGKGRKKKQVWRRPTGRDNKMRENKRGHPKVVSVGFRKPKKLKQENKKNFMIVRNIEDLKKLGKVNQVIIGHVGKKKRMEIINKAEEMKIAVKNLNKKTKENESR
ncbi:MAG: eL32 family ribosomal protein [Candidatus Pacearchaeota archaeon]